MPFYQLRIVLKPFKDEEFFKSMRSFACRIRKEKGCLGFSVYRDAEKGNAFNLGGEWETREAMETHFKTLNFEVLIGAAKVLGETFEMDIGETLKKGGLELAREQIVLEPKESTAQD